MANPATAAGPSPRPPTVEQGSERDRPSHRIAELLLAAVLLPIHPVLGEQTAPATPVTTAPLSALLIHLNWEAPPPLRRP